MISSEKNINKPFQKKRVLVAPLDWGLGHATRCVPIIRELISAGYEVFIGAEKGGALLLQKEFPGVAILPLKGYRISYSKNENLFILNMMRQIPGILSAIRKEHSWLQKTIKKYSIDIVISDNRFGLYSKLAHCVFITHQLFIKTGNRFTEKTAQLINYRYINRFNECWVPDEDGEENLAGDLSHPEKMPAVPVKYIGNLSRFEKTEKEKTTDLLVMLSGPEPQRTVFEKLLVPQMAELKLKMVLVRGLPSNETNRNSVNDHFTIFDHLPGNELNELITGAELVLARSGYTTVMELAALQKKAILVPTPGQTEQEYLADYLSEKKYCITESQYEFDLSTAINNLSIAKGIGFPVLQSNLLKSATQSLL